MKNGSKSGKYNGIITREEESLIADIEELKKQGRWIIIGNHHSSKFPDYLPMFWYLWDDILEKTLFFTGPYNLEMNRREFPGYEFVAAVESGREEMHELMETVKLKLKKMKDQWGYIFLLPAGPWEDSGNKPFQALFGQILRWLCSGEDTQMVREIFQLWHFTLSIAKDFRMLKFSWKDFDLLIIPLLSSENWEAELIGHKEDDLSSEHSIIHFLKNRESKDFFIALRMGCIPLFEWG